VGDAGVSVDGEDYAIAVQRLLSRPEAARRAGARARAEQFGWAAAVEGFLDAHGSPVAAPV
jgi:alpha-1,6-mannosyltransferase